LSDQFTIFRFIDALPKAEWRKAGRTLSLVKAGLRVILLFPIRPRNPLIQYVEGMARPIARAKRRR
jgi:hypothetical protein